MSATAPRYRSHFNPYLGEEVELPAPPEDALTFHRSLPGYEPTPLYSLPGLAEELGVGQILVKDEARRFELGAFKALGASYAIYRQILKKWEEKTGEPFSLESFLSTDVSSKLGAITFATATDGNHGRAVAWTARKLKQKAVIYVPKNTVPARIDHIRAEGAEVVVVDGTYDLTVDRAARDAKKMGWQIISDTAWPGYMEIPGWIMGGYSTIFFEAEEEIKAQLLPRPDVVFLQAGVGGLAGAGVMYYNRPGSKYHPKLVSVEPIDADCLLESILSENGQLTQSLGSQNSIMAGLNCGTPSLLAWPWLRSQMDYFLAIDDIFAEEAMRRFYRPPTGEAKIVSGESGAAGLAGLFALCRKPELEEDKERLGLDESSTVLVINTEGATDPVNFEKIVGEKL